MKIKSLLLALALLVPLCASAFANSWYVTQAGSATTVCGQSNPCGTLQNAMNAVGVSGLGTSPVVHVGTGSYSFTSSPCSGITTNVCVNQDGTATNRLVVQCDTQPCKLTGAPSGGYAVVIEANYVDFVGFEVGPCSGCNAGIAILGGSVFNSKGVNVHVLNNYVHDIAQSGNDGNGFGNGCPSSGMIISDFKGQNIPGLQVVGNRINNGGLMSLGGACNQFHGLYVNGATLVQNNLISNVVGEGINFGPSPCGGKITNNTVFRNGQRGILIASYSGDNCASNGGDGRVTVTDNIAVRNGVNSPSVGCGIGESGAVGATNLYSNNLLQGNTHGDTVCLQSNPASSVVNTKVEVQTATFVAYNDNGLGDYHIKAGSVAVQGGTSNGASGVTGPFVPTVDFAGTPVSNPIQIGAYTFLSGAALPPAAPSLSIVVN